MVASGGSKADDGVSGVVVAWAGDVAEAGGAGFTTLDWAWAGAFAGAGMLLMAGAAKLIGTSLLAVTCGWLFSTPNAVLDSKVSGLWATPA